MEPDRRIEELEAEVARLKRQLGAGEGAGLLHDWSERVDRALRGDSEESIEMRIGGVWLSRIAAVLTMTAAGIGARAGFEAEALLGFAVGPWHKALIGYLLAVLFLGYGLYARHRALRGRSRVYEALFAESMLGCGLAGLYFVTFATAFIEPMRLFPQPLWALPLLAACLALLAGVSHWQRSPTVAGIGFFLACYTVVFATAIEPTYEGLLYALLTTSVLAAATLLFHLSHRWMPLSWAALAAAYAAYLWLFVWNTQEALTGPPAFWLPFSFLSLNYVLFMLTGIVDARRRGGDSPAAVRLALANFTLFSLLGWSAVEGAYPGYSWVLFLTLAAANAFLVPVAERRGGLRGSLAAMAALVLAAAAADALPRALLLWALPLEALVLLAVYRWQQAAVYLKLSLLFSALTFALAMFSLNLAGQYTLDGLVLPSNWLAIGGPALVFALLAAAYEHAVPKSRSGRPMRRRKADKRKPAFRIDPAAVSVLHAAATALLLMTFGILHWGSEPLLPFVLMLLAIGGAAAGLLLRTPQLEIGAVLLLGGAHVCFHIFYWGSVDGFMSHPWFDLGAALLAAVTFAAARAWERYLERIQRHAREKGGEQDWTADLEHQIIAALPYVGGAFTLTTLLAHVLPALYLPGGQAALGVAMVLVGYRYDFNGAKAAGVFAMAAATVSFYTEVYARPELLANRPLFLAAMGGYLAAMALAERLVAYLESREAHPAKIEDLLRSSMVAVLLTMGALGLFEATPPLLLPAGLLAFGAVLMLAGVVFRESRYRWASLAIFAVAVGAAVVGLDFDHVGSFLSFAAAAAVLLAVSWIYTRRGGKKAPTDG